MLYVDPCHADYAQGELLPFQGGTNEMIAHKLYQSLTEKEKDRLHIYNYVAKDQTRPIHNKFKKRSCHSKYTFGDVPLLEPPD